MGELERLTAYTNMRYENMVYQKKVRAAVSSWCTLHLPSLLKHHRLFPHQVKHVATFFFLLQARAWESAQALASLLPPPARSLCCHRTATGESRVRVSDHI